MLRQKSFHFLFVCLLLFQLSAFTNQSQCDEINAILNDLYCLSLDFTPVPFAGSLCSMVAGEQTAENMLWNVGFILLDVVTLGQSHYIKAGQKSVSHLARMVQKGGKIIKAIQVGGKQFKSLRLAAKQLKILKEIFNRRTNINTILSNLPLIIEFFKQIKNDC